MGGRSSQDTPGFLPAPRTYPGQRARSFGPNRVRQNVGTPLLKEHGRVVHQSDSQSAAFHTAGRYGWLDVRNEAGRRFRPAGQLPSERVEKPGRLRSIRIVEALSVKVLRKSQGACTLFHESPCDQRQKPSHRGRRRLGFRHPMPVLYYWQPLSPLVRQMEEVMSGGISRPFSAISFLMNAAVSGWAIADCTPTRTRPCA